MATLRDATLRQRIENGEIGITPIDLETQIQPATVDVRMGHEITNMKTGESRYFEEGEVVPFEPGTFYLGSTLEEVSIPDDLIAALEGRSSIGRTGLAVHVTAGILDPGFEGDITLEIKNHGHDTVYIKPRQRVGQLEFRELDGPAEKPYGVKEDSKYQNQSGPTESRLDDDTEWLEDE